LVGKWHLGFYKWPYVPTRRGFDTAYGFWGSAVGHFDHKFDGVVDFRNGTEPVTNLEGKYATYEYVKVRRSLATLCKRAYSEGAVKVSSFPIPFCA